MFERVAQFVGSILERLTGSTADDRPSTGGLSMGPERSTPDGSVEGPVEPADAGDRALEADNREGDGRRGSSADGDRADGAEGARRIDGDAREVPESNERDRDGEVPPGRLQDVSPDTESVRVGDDRSSGEPEEHRRIRREGSQRDDGGNRDRDVDEGSRHGWVSSISDETVVEWACSLERDDQDVRSGIATTDRSRRWTSSTSDGPLDSRMGWEDESTGARERDEPVQGASTSGGFDWVGDGDDGSADGDSETEANDAGFRWVGEEDFGHDSPAEPGEDSPEAGRDGATAAESGTTSDRDGFDWIGDAGGPRASDGPEDEWTAWIQDDDALSWAKSLEERTRSEAEGGEVNWGELVDDYGIEPDEDGERN